MKLYSIVYGVKTACSKKKKKKKNAIPFLVSELLLFDFFSDYHCEHHNFVTVWNICMKPHGNVYEVKTACHVQK